MGENNRSTFGILLALTESQRVRDPEISGNRRSILTAYLTRRERIIPTGPWRRAEIPPHTAPRHHPTKGREDSRILSASFLLAGNKRFFRMCMLFCMLRSASVSLPDGIGRFLFTLSDVILHRGLNVGVSHHSLENRGHHSFGPPESE